MKKRGQVWVETVTYTLVAFILIGLILSFAKPKIQEMQDQTVIEQSMKAMKDIDFLIREVGEQGIGNKRALVFDLRKGSFTINSSNDSIIFQMVGRFMYSEPGLEYNEGGFDVLTTKKGKEYTVTIKKFYPSFNLTYEGKEVLKRVTGGANPYTFYVSNKGGETNNIDFQIG